MVFVPPPRKQGQGDRWNLGPLVWYRNLRSAEGDCRHSRIPRQTTSSRRFRPFVLVGCRRGVRHTADLRPDGQIIGDVPLPDLCSATNGSRYSTTSSAPARSAAGTARPNVFAVLRLMTSRYLSGSTTGMSPAFSPLRIRP